MDTPQSSTAHGSADYTLCPIPAAHRRLAEAHVLWHQALDQYQEPNAFRANLNATIQALRNVTFALQAEKHAIPDFDAWYSRWQEALASDSVARWLVKARNVVVKQGELAISSTALVRVLTWKDDLLVESDVPPESTNAFIVANLELLELLKKSTIPPGDLKHAALAIERRWSVAELAGQEILSALAHVHGVLSSVILDAHIHLNRFGCIPSQPVHPDFVSAHNRTGMLSCMAIGSEQRTARIQLATGATLHVHPNPRPAAGATAKQAADRYGLGNVERLPGWQASDPVAVANKILYAAKKMLRKDKGLARMMFIRDGHGTWHQAGLSANDRTEKHILMRIVASFVESVGADAVIDVAEAWMLPETASAELRDDFANMEHAPSRREVVSLLIATREGLLRQLVTPFARGPLGGIKLEDTHETDDRRAAFYLAPVFEVWKRQGAHTTATGKTLRRLWEPDPLDACYCGSGKRFGECCKPHMERAQHAEGAIAEALRNDDAATAVLLARAAVAQYVIWIKRHTVGTRHVADDFHRKMIDVDIPALQGYLMLLKDALQASGSKEFRPSAQRVAAIVGLPEASIRLRAIVALELWEQGDSDAAAAEIRNLGELDVVRDSMALILAAKLLDLPDSVACELLERAADSGYGAAERVSNKLELARTLVDSSRPDKALLWIDSAVREATDDGRLPALRASALALKWHVTNDEQDYQRAREAVALLEGPDHEQDLAILLVDHGDYDDAETILAGRIAQGDVAACLVAIDGRLRAGRTDAAKELLGTIQADTVSPELQFPYAYTSGLVAGVSGDAAVRQRAIDLLREISFTPPAMRPVADALRDALQKVDGDEPTPQSWFRRFLSRTSRSR